MSYHRISVIGYVGSNPEYQLTATGKDFSYFPLYVNERFGDNERTTRYKVKAWNELGLREGDALQDVQPVHHADAPPTQLIG